MRIGAGFCIVLALAATTAAYAASPTWKQRGWFVFRDAAEDNNAFLRGVRAFVLNDWGRAEKEFTDLISAAPSSTETKAARAYLCVMYDVSGRHREALTAHNSQRSHHPWRRDIAAILSAYPNQQIVEKRSSSVRFIRDDAGHLVLPAIINGKPAPCMIDTGSDFSDMSESQARQLGLRIHPITRDLPTADGRGALHLTGVAVAENLSVGDFRLRNVPFLLLREEEGSNTGTIGMNVLRAFETFRWTADGSFEIGFPAGPREPNAATLCLSIGGVLLTETSFGGQRLTSMLDTGAAKSFLKAGFAKAFPALIRQSGSKTSYDPGFIGRPPRQLKAASLSEITLTVGGCEARLRNVPVLLKQAGENSWDYAHVGIDVLGAAKMVSLDLKAMKLRIDGCGVTGP